MGVVTVSSAPSKTPPLRINSTLLPRHRPLFILAFKSPDPNPLKSATKPKKQPNKIHPISLDTDFDYSELAEALENIYKLSPADARDTELEHRDESVGSKRRKRRLSLDARVSMRGSRKEEREREEVEVVRLLREYSVSIDLVSLDWRKSNIPPVLSLAEHDWLFKLMQPIKVKQ